MRQRIFLDKSGNLCGEFPHDAQVGFVPHRRGLRRRLVAAADRNRLGDDSAMTLAFSLYATKEKEIRETQFVKNESKARADHERKNITVRGAATIWFSHLEVTVSNKTLNAYKQTVDIYLSSVGNHLLKEFIRDHNIQFYKALSELKSIKNPSQPISAATQNMHMRQLNIFLRWAHDNDYLDKVVRLKKAKVPAKEMEVFSIKHLGQLKTQLLLQIEQADTPRRKVNALNLLRAFNMATSCLMRKGAIAAQQLKNIDMDARIIKIRDVPELSWKNKGYKWPNKPINTSFYEFLKEDLAARGPKEKYYLDDGHGNTWYADISAISRSMTKACKAAGLPSGVKPFHWGMRAALITWLLNAGESPQKVQQLADHASVQTTMKYYNTREASQREAVDTLPSF
jgi:integrase